MKAKEYVEKYFSDLTPKITEAALFEMLKLCFIAFNDELREVTKPLGSKDSKIVKIKEFQKKWVAMADIIAKKPGMTDALNMETISGLFDEYFQKQHPVIFEEIKGVKADPSRIGPLRHKTQTDVSVSPIFDLGTLLKFSAFLRMKQ